MWTEQKDQELQGWFAVNAVLQAIQELLAVKENPWTPARMELWRTAQREIFGAAKTAVEERRDLYTLAKRFRVQPGETRFLPEYVRRLFEIALTKEGGCFDRATLRLVDEISSNIEKCPPLAGSAQT